MIEKFQRFMKNKHKFDRDLDPTAQIELFDSQYRRFKEAVKSDNRDTISQELISMLIELVKYSNTKDIEWEDLLSKQMK